ncbi:MAG TPA: type 1 glutamine amidotransferase, partial [Actinomycetota bacterium]|nr:type 1 glutamine amidotransferase [Actinomycetota bacterium]
EEGGGPGQLAVAAAATGLALDVRAAAAADVPERLGAAAGLVVLGASYDVRDAERFPHLYRVMDLIREAASDERPVLGVCLGGQLAAEALGGRVERGDHGPEIGWRTVRATEEASGDPVAAAVGPAGTPLLLWHHDVFVPPPGAVRLLTSDGYPEQGFRLGSVWGVQSHPEADEPVVAEWVSSPGGAKDLRANGVAEEDMLGPAPTNSPGALRLLEAWCRVVAANRAP